MSEKVNGTRLFTLGRLKENFAQVDEDVLVDLTAIKISAILDVHYNDIELTVEIYGKGGTEDSPILSEKVTGLSGTSGAEIDDELLEAGLSIQPTLILALFDQPTRQLLASRGIGIIWNDEWPSRAEIDPISPDSNLVLEAEAQ